MWMHTEVSADGARHVTIWAPAKLNLFLQVLGKRPDGYHEIETLMAPVGLFDVLDFQGAHNGSGAIGFSAGWVQNAWSTTAQQGELPAPPSATYAEINGEANAPLRDPIIPRGAENLVVKAVELLRRRAGTDASATIRLTKRIPMAAGLGGGSSDAAAALVAANEAWQLGWSTRQLLGLAAELGSDVPFFLARSAAVCRGRGEEVEPLAPLAARHCLAAGHFVIVQPPEGLATAEVYRHCRPGEISPRTSANLIAALSQGDVSGAGRCLHNALQEPAERLSPWIRRLKRDFSQLGFAAHQMTGSGASYFGWSRHAPHARRAAARLRQRGWRNVYVVRGYP